MEGLEFKSKCLIDLNMLETFQDLPKAFHVLLFDELYGDYVRSIPELSEMLNEPQLQTLANALSLEIYLPEDLIIEEGRIGSKLFIMKKGAADIFSSQSQMVFAAVHEGVLFGDLSFFLAGIKQLVSVRASRSCQILFIHRRDWMALWSEATRLSIENKIIPVMKHKYRSMSRSFLNIFKNFELAKARHMDREMSSKLVHTHAIEEEDGNENNESSAASEYKSRTSKSDRINSSRSITTSRQKPLKLTARESRRKLSAHLGLPRQMRELKMSISLKSSAVANIEEEWRRHERNLKVLALIDQQSEKENNVLDIARRSSNPGLQNEVLVHESPQEESNPSAITNSTMMLLSRVTSDHILQVQQKIIEAGITKRVGTVNSGLGTLRAATGSKPSGQGNILRVDAGSKPSGHGKRHSIQIVGQDMKKSLASIVNGQHTAQEHMPFGLSASTAAKKLLSIHSLPEEKPASEPGEKEHEHHRPSALDLLHQHHFTVGATMIHVEETPRNQSEGHSYAKHLDTLKSRSKRRQHKGVFQSEDEMDELKNPYEIWVEPPLPPAFCMENAPFRHIWNAIMLMICCYYILVVPFRISFDFEFLTSTESPEMIIGWFGLEYALDILCVIDFFLQKDYFTYIYKGEIVTDKKAIRNHYLKEGTYLSDLFCILPFEVLTPMYSAFQRYQGVRWDVTWYRVAVFRTNKMIRINRLHELSEKVQRSLVYDWKLTFITPSAVYFTRFAFDFALGAHWVACFFYSVSYNTFIEDGRASWLTTPGMLAYEGCTSIKSIGEVPVTRKFARSYHFSIGAITTVSYGDIAPQNAVETLLGTMVIVVSIVLFGMLAGGFFHLFEMEFGQRADYEERVARVANYMIFHRFHTRIWQQLQVYFAVHWQESKGMDEDELLRGLTTSVRQDIILYVKREFVVQMKLFATCEEAFVRAVVTAFQQELYVRHDVIIAEGDTGRSLYVIENGGVLVRITKKLRPTIFKKKSKTELAAASGGRSPLRLAADETIELVKGRFDFFGEKSLILDVPRSATCIALSSCSMLILTVEKYREILDDFPEYRERNMRDWIFANSTQDNPLQNPAAGAKENA